MSKLGFTRNILYRRECISSLFIHGCRAERMLCQKADKEDKVVEEDKEVLRLKELEEELKHAKPFKDIPKVFSLPFIGSSWIYFPIIGKCRSDKIHEADLYRHKVYGDIVREKIGKFNMVSSYDKNTMRIFWKEEGLYPSRAEFSTLKAYREIRPQWYKPLGLVAMQGEEWYNFRKHVSQYAFRQEVIGYSLRYLQDIARDFVELIRVERDSKLEVNNIMDYLYRWSLESITYVALDQRLGCLERNVDPESDAMKMIKSVHEQLECIGKMEDSSANFPFWKYKYIPSPTWRRFVKAADVFSTLAFKYVTNAAELCKKNPNVKNPSLLHRMLQDENLTEKGAMVAASDIIMAGIDTTSNAAGFFLYNLAKNQDKQELAYQEIIKRVPNKEDRFKHFRSPFFNRCLKESLRLHAIIRGNMRIFDHDVVIQGYRVPVGTAVMCMTQVIGSDERWYKNPKSFMPERWQDKNEEMMMLLAPFGYGKRACLGQFFADIEILSVVGELLRHFRVEYHYEDVGQKTRLVNIPDRPIRLRFIER